MKHFQLIRPYVMERKWYIAFGLVSLLIVDALQLFIPRIVKLAVDDIALNTSQGANLLRYCGYIVAAALIIGGFRFLWRYCIMGTARRVEEGIRERLFSHVQTLPATFFDTTPAGDIMAHSTNDIMNIRMAMGMGLVGLTDTIVLGCAAVGFMGYINLRLTLMALAPMPFIALFTKILSKKLFATYMETQASFSRLMEASRERFAGIRIIKAFNREDRETRSIESESLSYLATSMKLVKLRGLIFPLTILLTSISQAIVLGAGGRNVIFNDISPGEFVAFMSYLGLLTWPVMAVGWVANMLQRGKASIERIDAVMTTRPGIMDDPSATSPSLKGRLRLRDVSFSYGNARERKPALNSICLDVCPGEILGIAGPPGSGKTTLVSLLPRIYDPASGSITIDGIDIRKIRLATLRQAITYVPQEPFLFSGTIRENLLFGDPHADDKALETAVAMAQLTGTLAGFPKGLDTIIGEKGVMLSGGQKQRIALARAFLKQAPIMILDDPISQVDMETASRIVQVLEELSHTRTLIIASHRFTVFRNARAILVLDRGSLIESGTHPELVAQGGYYARANAMQITLDETGGAKP
ncbi:MAG: ABC transporter ATP-binding protein [Pseudomonadota bacterium]